MADDHDENQPVTPPLPGAQLRAERERRGLTLAQVASELHVDQRMLQGLEADDYEALGAPIFVKGHLRNYARLIGLDPAAISADYEAAQQPVDPDLVAQRPDGPRMEHHHPRAWVGWLGWTVLLVLGLGLAGWWYYQQEGGARLVLEPDAERGLQPREVERPVTSPQRPATSPGAEGRPAETESQVDSQRDLRAGMPTEIDDAGEAAGDPAPQTEERDAESRDEVAAPREQVQAPAPVQQPARPAGRPLVLEFNRESWVEIYDAEGRPILYDLVNAGSRREINATGQLRVFLGNAEGVDIFIRGERFAHQRFHRADNTARFTVNVPE